MQRVNLLEGLRQEDVCPLRQWRPSLDERADLGSPGGAEQVMRCGDIKREEREFESLGEGGRVRFQVELLGGRWRGWHGRRGSGRGEGEDARGGYSVSVGVELGNRSDVAFSLDGAAHHYDLLDAEESLGVFGCCQCAVGEGSNGHDGDGVCGVLLENAEYLFVSYILGGLEVIGWSSPLG